MVYLVLLTFLLFLVVLYLRTSLVIVTIQGGSMRPTLQPGERVLVWRHYLPQWLKRGQIVLVWPATMPPVDSTSRVRNPNLFAITPLIKRVVALPGDVIVTHIADIPEFEQQHHVELHNKVV
jgi:signal peptidase I